MKMAFAVQPLSWMYTSVHLDVSCIEVYLANVTFGIPLIWGVKVLHSSL